MEGIYVNTNQGSPTVWPQAWVWQLTGTLSPLLLGLAEPPWAGSQGRWMWVCLDVAEPWLTLLLGLPPLDPAWTCSSQRREPGSLPTFKIPTWLPETLFVLPRNTHKKKFGREDYHPK